MSTKFSAHPDLAVEQLQRAELAALQNSNKSHTNHRRHQSGGATELSSRRNSPAKSLISACKSAKANAATKYGNKGSNSRSTPVRTTTANKTKHPINALDNKFAYNVNTNANANVNNNSFDIDAMVLAYIDDIDLNCEDNGEDDVYIQNPNSRSRKTKDCVDCTPSSPATLLRWASATTTAAGSAQTSQDYNIITANANGDVDETDNMKQHHFIRTTFDCNSRQQQQQQSQQQQQLHYINNSEDNYYKIDSPRACAFSSSPSSSPIHAISDGCASGLSSVLSTPSASTVSSPLSTPTRLAPHFQQQNQQQHSSRCCQKPTARDCGDAGTSDSDKCCNQSNHHQHTAQHLHQHHHHQRPNHKHHTMASSMSLKSTLCKSMAAAAAAAATSSPTLSSTSSSSSSSSSGGCKKSQKFDPILLGPSRYRQLLPVVLCILSFAIVFSILIVYMDTTEIRHKQFRLNMSRDYEFFGVAQDDPTLIAFLREIHMRKYPMHFLKNAPLDDTSSLSSSSSTSTATSTLSGTSATYFNSSTHYEGLTPEMAHYVADLVGGKDHGTVIQSLPGSMGHLMTAPWLAATMNWVGLLVEPEPRRFFTLRKQNAHRPGLQVVHACISPNPYPKEVTIHNEESEVRINSLLDEETSWFNSRVKCFPLYSLMLACNRVEYDLLSLGVHGHELEILQTLPFDRVQIEVISIHLSEDIARGYVDALTEFLAGKSYKLQKTFGRNYFYQRNKTTSRTRKKDILLLKTP